MNDKEHDEAVEQMRQFVAKDPRAPEILKFFEFEHLPEKLQAVSTPFFALSLLMVTSTKPGAEQSAGLRKLLEAKDCFVRAAL